MKVIDQSFKILDMPTRGDALRRIAYAARNCYQSEGVKSDAEIVSKLLSSKPFPHSAMLEHGGVISVEYTGAIGETREVIRHRLASFAQESTRYCAYNGKRFDSSITFIRPNDWAQRTKAQRLAWLAQMASNEAFYMLRRRLGEKAERARDGLPLATKGRLIITANIRQWWEVIFPLRMDSHAHPQLREFMIDLHSELEARIPEIFGVTP